MKQPSKTPWRSILLSIWLIIFIIIIITWWQSDLKFSQVPGILQQKLSQFGLLPAALLYIILYTIRPLIFFPGTILTITSGIIFGPWLGIVLTFIGGNFSANFAFYIARILGRDAILKKETGFIKKWDNRLEKNGIVTVLLMRLIYLPFDGVNYGCGLTGMRQRDFAIGTALGIIPGLTTFVLLGGSASIHSIDMVNIFGVNISGRILIFSLSIVFFIGGLLFARYLRRYKS